MQGPNENLVVYPIITTHIADNAEITKLTSLKDINFDKKTKKSTKSLNASEPPNGSEPPNTSKPPSVTKLNHNNTTGM